VGKDANTGISYPENDKE